MTYQQVLFYIDIPKKKFLFIGLIGFIQVAVFSIIFKAEGHFSQKKAILYVGQYFKNRDTIGTPNLYFTNSVDYNQTYPVAINNQIKSYFSIYSKKEGDYYSKMKTWATPYFNLYDQILTKYGLPKQLKYLSVIESSLNPATVSWAGAAGPWQLMDYEANKYGLTVSETIDERKDFKKSTAVAAQLLKDLYGKFGDWLLVIAAYNGGEGRVREAIKKANSKDFWVLQQYLKEETRMHVKKFIMTHHLFEGTGGLTTMTAEETKAYFKTLERNALVEPLTQEELNQTMQIQISGRYLSAIVANYLNMTIEKFEKWNPGFNKKLAAGEAYPLRISKEKLPEFENKKEQILTQSLQTLIDGYVID